MKNHKSSCLITSGVGRTDDQDERPEMIKKQENRQVTDTDTLPKQVPILLGGGPTVVQHSGRRTTCGTAQLMPASVGPHLHPSS